MKRWSREHLQKAIEHMTADDFQRESAQKALEEIVSWDNAVDADTYEAFHQHLKAWPEGRNRAEATAMMEYHGRWKQLSVSEGISSSGNRI